VADNKHICLVLADITKCAADALIIPNGSRLECTDGLAFQISEAGLSVAHPSQASAVARGDIVEAVGFA
jgi:O-acetyl-ADP-ribose deacetylase (regulator of RNase III)